VLKKDGVFLLVECQLNRPAKKMQDVFFELAYSQLIKIGKPLPFFLSQSEIASHLRQAGFRLIKTVSIPSGQKIFLPLFPAITIPGSWWDKLSQTHLFVAKKIESL